MTTNKQQREVIKRRLAAWGSARNDCEWRMDEIKALQKQLEDADNILRAQKIDDMPRGTGIGDPTNMAMQVRERTAKRIARLLEEVNEIMADKEQMDAAIDLLPERYKHMLDLRIVKGKSLSVEIPRLMHISERTAAYWMDDILEKLHLYFESLHDIAESLE